MTLRKKKMDSDMQKLPLMSHGGPGHVPRAGLYWYNLLAGRSAGWLASGLCTPASLAYRRCTSFGIEIWTINHVLSSFACLLAYLCAGCLVYSSRKGQPAAARSRRQAAAATAAAAWWPTRVTAVAFATTTCHALLF